MKLNIGIPSARYYQPFWESISSFLVEAKKKYEIEVNVVRDLPIDQARTKIVESFLSGSADYLLFLDDDHEGHTIEMLNALVSVNTHVCAIKCHSRFFPYLPNVLYYSGFPNERVKYKYHEMGNGFHESDLVGFGMTLIRRDTFDKFELPYFVGEDNRKEDNYFCDKLIKSGIRPVGCWDFTLSHQGIGSHNFQELKETQMKLIIEDLVKKNPGITTGNFSMVV